MKTITLTDTQHKELSTFLQIYLDKYSEDIDKMIADLKEEIENNHGQVHDLAGRIDEIATECKTWQIVEEIFKGLVQ